VKRDDYWATLTVISGLAGATLTGFLRQAAIARELGAGRDADIFLVAFAIPEFVFVALPIVLFPAFIPLFVECRQKSGEVAARRFGLRVGGALLIFLLAITIAAWLGASFYIAWLSPGFSYEERAQAVQVTRLMLPGLGFMGLVTLVSAVMQVYRRFGRPAWATAIYNITFIIVLLFAPLPHLLDRAGWAVTIGAIASLVFLLTPIQKHRSRQILWKPEITRGTAVSTSVAQVAWLAGPLAAGYGAHHLILFVDRAMATTLGAGSAAALNYADHLAQVIGQFSGLAVSTVLFPRLSERIYEGRIDEARHSLAWAMRLVWKMALPASAGLILLRTPVVHVLFERGAFDRQATMAVSAALIWYTLSTLSDAICQPLWRVVYAQRKAWTVFGVNSLQTAIRVISNVVLIGLFGYIGLAISALIGLTVQAGVLSWLVRRSLGFYVGAGWWRDVGLTILATSFAVASAGIAYHFLYSAQPIFQILVCGTLVCVIYLIVLSLPKFLGGIYHRVKSRCFTDSNS
jgi:putative peptidoglycan lipid II flippase